MLDGFKLAELFRPVFTETIHNLSVKSFGKMIKMREKSETQLVSELDLAIDRVIADFFGRNFPDKLLVSEESFTGRFPVPSDFVLCDPVDGTNSFLMGLPTFGSMLALIRDGRPVLGIVFLPAKQLLSGDGFHFAALGQGAWRFGSSGWEKLSVSQRSILNSAVLLFDGPKHQLDHNVLIGRLKSLVRRSRSLGSACWSGVLVASGGLLPYGADFLVNTGLKPWDNLPIALLVEEAGGKVTDFFGKPYSLDNCSDLILSNGVLHEAILQLSREKKQ